jgi:hypothetical protein
MKSPRTTVLGILAIVGALVAVGQALASGHAPDYASTASAIMAGIGLITARDNNVTSEQAGAK